MKIYFSVITVVLVLTVFGILSPTYAQWLNYEIDTDINAPVLLYAADIDKDGDLDLAAAGEQDDDVVWYENMGGTPVSWTQHTIDGNLDLAFAVRIADIDGDDTLDVIATGQDADDVIWYENNHPTWTPHLIDGNLDGARTLYISDIDGDNMLDVIATGYDGDEVVWYKNEHPNWKKYSIDEDLDGANDVITADLDGDDWQDVIVSGFFADKVVWYKNLHGVTHVQSVQSYPRFVRTLGDTLVINAQIYNPEGRPATSHAVINGEQYAFYDSLQLYDDGLHRDGFALDNIWETANGCPLYRKIFMRWMFPPMT